MYSFILLKYFSFLEIIYNLCVLARLSAAVVQCLVRARVVRPQLVRPQLVRPQLVRPRFSPQHHITPYQLA